jgi:AcrR family transcriptional regulator
MSSRKQNTRERILQTTIRLLESGSGQAVRLEDIADAAGVSRQAIYLHFASRTDLFIATARYLDSVLGLQERLTGIKQACEAGDGGQALREMVAFWAGYLPEVYPLAKPLLVLRETDEAAAAAWDDRMASAYQGCLSVVAQLSLEGRLAESWTIETAAEFFWALLSVEVWERLTRERDWTNEQYRTRLQQAAQAALVAGAAG